MRVGSVDVRWLFNNYYTGALVLDARPRDAFAQDALVGALSIPPEPECTSFAQLVPPAPTGSDSEDSTSDTTATVSHSLSTSRRTLRDIVIYGDAEQVRDPESWLFRLQQLLVEDALVASAKTLADGFASFKYRYPFYTTLGVKGLAACDEGQNHRVSYPSEILPDFLYLGNMWQAQSRQVIVNLGITHIVNASQDVGNVFEKEGVLYHDVKLRDDPDSDIIRFFDSTFRFIDHARHTHTTGHSNDGRTRPCRVLVHCTQGVSRSATLVVMYLMRARRWSLVQAFNYAHEARGVILPNEGFLRQLLFEERRLYYNHRSIEESELDQLLRGQLADRPIGYMGAPSEYPQKCSIM